MKKHILGLPRIGKNRELKKSLEKYWKDSSNLQDLLDCSKKIRHENLNTQVKNNLDLITVGDFSLYDQILDTSIMLSNIPKRFLSGNYNKLDRYFNIARGTTENKKPVTASDMRKYFNTNYHYIVPEFSKDTKICLDSSKLIYEIKEAIGYGIAPARIKPVVVGPLTYLWLSKEVDIDKFQFYNDIKGAYFELFSKIKQLGVEWVQVDEPILVLDEIDESYSNFFKDFYCGQRELKILLTTYFDSIDKNIELINSLEIDALHVDITKPYSGSFTDIELLKNIDIEYLSVGCVDGRNVWVSDYAKLNRYLSEVKKYFKGKLWVSTSSSLQYLPVTKHSEGLPEWLSFAHERIHELNDISDLINGDLNPEKLNKNIKVVEKLRMIREKSEANKTDTINNAQRVSTYEVRKTVQDKKLGLPKFPTTTIGSFPQSKELRSIRNKWRNNKLSNESYEKYIKSQIQHCINFQEEIGLDVLVHGEFERTDMVEYFAEHLDGYLTTKKGWIQSYGSRCVKPGIIYSNINRPNQITTGWITYAQSLTNKFVKGMLTGPVTMLKWSFVRNDIPYEETLNQMSSAINEEVLDLENNGIKIIQIDEAALREGLPLKNRDKINYKKSASKSFRLTTFGVKDETQIHTHMCYSNFDDILDVVSEMDADVITIETSRSNMSLLSNLSKSIKLNSIGPGVYDIHSPNIPNIEQVNNLIKKARLYIPDDRLWINPDCGLKTRRWEEVKESLVNMVQSAITAR